MTNPIFILEYIDEDGTLNTLQLTKQGITEHNQSLYTTDEGDWTVDENICQISLIVTMEKIPDGTEKITCKTLGTLDPNGQPYHEQVDEIREHGPLFWEKLVEHFGQEEFDIL